MLPEMRGGDGNQDRKERSVSRRAVLGLLEISAMLVQNANGESVPRISSKVSATAIRHPPSMKRQSKRSVEPSRTAPNRTRTRVLVVDDDALIRELTKVILEKHWGVKVLRASTNRQALRAAEHHKFNLVITDYIRSGGDGLEFLREFKRRHPHTPVVMVTGHAATVRHRARRMGASACLSKFPKLHRLLALRRMLDSE
jgi:CheY-like chemotaxis protein